jgi:hypothetical protein
MVRGSFAYAPTRSVQASLVWRVIAPPTLEVPKADARAITVGEREHVA